MLKYNQERLEAQTMRRNLRIRIGVALERIVKDYRLAVAMILYIAIVIGVNSCMPLIVHQFCEFQALEKFFLFSYRFTFLTLAIIILVFSLIMLGTPWDAQQISDKLHRAGVVNKIDEPPLLLSRKKDPENTRITILEFMTAGITRSELEDLQPKIESALDSYVVSIKSSSHPNRVLLYTVAASSCIPEVVRWPAGKPFSTSPNVIMGQTVAGTDVKVNLSHIPHMLIGGSTGSGKTVLLRFILKQCIQKGYKVYVADFKGGIDYAKSWHTETTLITGIDALLPVLASIVTELKNRTQLFLDSGSSNLEQYNAATGSKLKRIIFAVDEVAELLDKTGASKEAKADIDTIVSQLSTIARLGRAFGIHLILATQRPDAAIMPGQIKNNIDIRACGRADQVLSQIILDNADAAEKIPKDSHLFLLQDGTLFQPYVYSEK